MAEQKTKVTSEGSCGVPEQSESYDRAVKRKRQLDRTETPIETERTELVCPSCCIGGRLHQVAVQTLFREEDRDGTNVLIVEEDMPKVRKNSVGSFPCDIGRRDILCVYFYCEQCHLDNDDPIGHRSCSRMNLNDYHKLVIRQHKGSTEIFWSER